MFILFIHTVLPMQFNAFTIASYVPFLSPNSPSYSAGFLDFSKPPKHLIALAPHAI
jgi:hypothetical protein